MINQKYCDFIVDTSKKVGVVKHVCYYYAESSIEISFEKFRMLFDVPTNWGENKVENTVAYLRTVLKDIK
jgi:hypothetical protein